PGECPIWADMGEGVTGVSRRTPSDSRAFVVVRTECDLQHEARRGWIPDRGGMIDALKRSLPPFVSAAVRNPKTVGAAAPSSRALAARMASAVPAVEAPTIVEIG